MNGLLETLETILATGEARLVLQAMIILAIGLSLAMIANKYLPLGRLHPHHQLLFRRTISYVVVGITVTLALRELGVNLGVLLGAAGVLTIVIGFAAQTSASNLISGLFLMGEQPFVVGDVIRVGDIAGAVVSIDLLSVRLRTSDNLLVRIPNDSMLKSNVTNLTHFPIRRLDMKISVAYKEEIQRVRELLMETADRNPICLAEPKPLFIFLGFGESSINLQFSTWSTQQNFLELRNTMHEDVKRTFDEHGIEIPFPHHSLYAGSVSKPFQIEVVGADGRRAAENPMASDRPEV